MRHCKYGLLLLGLLSVACLLGCSRPGDPWDGETATPRVVVTIAPLASFVHAVAGDSVAMRCLCTSTGPHHYQADTKDARVLTRAELMLAIGMRLDDTFADAMRSMAQRTDLHYVKLGQRLPAKELLEFKHSHDHSHDGDHHHHHGKYDPHIWLGLTEAITMTNVIAEELGKVNPAKKEVYAKNAEAYKEKLRALHEEGKELLKGSKTRRIISFHEALGYLARSFDLQIADVIEQGPGDEPSGTHLAKLIHLCQDPKNPIGAITVEPQYPKSSSAMVIQKELKSKGFKIPLVEIDPLETANVDELKKEGGEWYLKRMRDNLQALAKALK